MGPTLPRITLISSAAPLGALPEALTQIERRYGKLFELKIYLTHLIQEQAVDSAETLASISSSQVVLFDLRGNPDRAVALVRQGFEQTQSQGTAFIPVFGGGPAVLALLRMGSFTMARMSSWRNPNGEKDGETTNSAAMSTNYRRIKQITEVVERVGSLLPIGTLRHARNWVRCVNYWTNNGVYNIRELLLFVGAEYAGLKVRSRRPMVFPDDGFLDIASKQRHATLASYAVAQPRNPDLPNILIILFGGTTLDACVAGAGELFDALARHANVFPFFADGIGTAHALKKHLLPNGKPVLKLDAIISLQWFRLEGGPLGGDPQVTYDLLAALGAPFYTAVTSYNRTISAWQCNADGVSPVETLASITLPELDGAIDPVFLFGLRDEKIGDQPVDIGGKRSQAQALIDTTAPVPGRGQRLAGRVLKRIALRRKPNAEKKIALVIYNYPPGEGNLGNASFLDSFASVEAMLRRLKAEGYTLDLPAEPIRDLLLNRGLVNHAEWTGANVTDLHARRVSVDDYMRWYATLPVDLRCRTEELFGPPPGDLYTNGRDFLLPIVKLGNVLLALQPSRGVHEDPQKTYHDKALPPHHQYIAFYRYLEEAFGADAVVHIGTHGTLEFTPGKEAALSGDDAPDALLGDLPHVYVYHVVNASEAMIAKRRSYAQIITYASPSFAPAELYGEYLELEDLLGEFEHQRKDNPARAVAVLRQIAEKAAAAGLGDWTFEGELQPPMAQFQSQLDQLHAQLSVLKRAAIPIGLHVFGERLRDEGLAGYLSLIARYDRPETPALTRALAQQRGLDFDTLVAGDDPRLVEFDRAAREVIDTWLNKGEWIVETRNVDKSKDNAGNQQTHLQAPGAYLATVRANIEVTDEMGALIEALNGQFILPNLAGDPVRSPETYPTGRNAYQFDPTRVPTTAAMERGRTIAEESLRQYYDQHGSYPAAVGVVLWGFETCKTYGETIGQILGYLGVTIDRGEGYYIKPIPIPLAALGRPRVDVTVNICGFFRDLFPNQVRMLDQAFRVVAALDEPLEQNRVRRNTLAIQQADVAGELAVGRIFGPPPGEYGNRLSTMIEHGQWQNEAELAQMFMQRTQYVYGDNVHGVAAPQLLENCLRQVDLVTQVRDSHEFEITDVDHYYEFFGGLARSAQELRGSAPTVLIADTTRERIKVQSVQVAVQQGVVTRLLNPKWIDSMLAHDFHGSQHILNRIEYLIGLDATTKSVGTQTWSRVAQRYLFDQELRQRMLENNPYAEAEIAQKLGEAMQRRYWQPTEEEQQKLQQVYAEIEQWIEERQ